jgi:hypothetical protein
MSHQLNSKPVLSDKLHWGHYFQILKSDNIGNQLFVSKYRLFLPEKELLERELEKLLDDNKE